MIVNILMKSGETAFQGNPQQQLRQTPRHRHNSYKIIFLILLSGCQMRMSDHVTDSSFLVQKGKYSFVNERPIEGEVVEFYVLGGIKNQSTYANGLKHGPSTSWYPDGQKESVRYYVKGEKDGFHRGWWPNGNRRFEYNFNDGLYNGHFKEWYEDGKPLHDFQYNNGNEVRAVGWRENGKTYINFVVRHGKKYGLTNARLCFSLVDEQGVYKTSKQ